MAPKAKIKHRRQLPAASRQGSLPPFQPGTVQVSLGYDPRGKMESRDVVGYKEGWSEYSLEDGSTLRVKAVLLDVKRAVDQFTPDGDPLYVLQYAVVNQLKAPDQLKKQG